MKYYTNGNAGKILSLHSEFDSYFTVSKNIASKNSF